MVILIVVLYAVLAFAFIAAKQALLCAQPFFLVALRMMIAGCLLIGYHLLSSFNKQTMLFCLKDSWLFMQVAIFNIYLSFSLEFWSLQYISGFKAVLFYAPTPFITAFFAYALYHERLSWQQLLGSFIGFMGVIVVIVMGAHDDLSYTFTWCHLSMADIVLASAVIIGSYAWFIVKKLLDRGYSIIAINGISMLLGGFLSGLTSLILERSSVLVSDWHGCIWWTTLLILSSNFLFYNLYGYLLRHYSLTLISVFGFLCPIFTAFYEILFFNTVITWHYCMSIACVTIGLYLFYRENL